MKKEKKPTLSNRLLVIKISARIIFFRTLLNILLETMSSQFW